MEGMARIVEAADSFYAIVAIALLGIFALLWKYGGKILELLRENNRLTREAHEIAVEAKDTATDIQQSIVTNHGSKNIGDAMDRLTESVWEVRDQGKETSDALAALVVRFEEHVAGSTNGPAE